MAGADDLHDLFADPQVAAGGVQVSAAQVWMLLILLIATLIAGITGLLAFAGGAGIPNAIPTAGAAFGGTVALLLGLAHFLGTGRG